MSPESPETLLRQHIVTLKPKTAQTRHGRQRLSSLINKFICQVRDGCGNTKCTKSACYTKRLRSSDRPLRKLNGVSAKAIATHLASSDHCEALLCDKWSQGEKLQPPSQNGRERVSNLDGSSKLDQDVQARNMDGRRDHTSFSQRLFDSPAVSELIDSYDVEMGGLLTNGVVNEDQKCLNIISFPLTVALASVIDRTNDATDYVPLLGSTDDFIRQTCRHVFENASRIAKSFYAHEQDLSRNEDLRRWQPASTTADKLWQILLRYYAVEHPSFPFLDERDGLTVPASTKSWVQHCRSSNDQRPQLNHLNPIIVDSTLRWWIAKTGDLVFESLYKSLDTLKKPICEDSEVGIAHTLIIYIQALIAALPTTSLAESLTNHSTRGDYPPNRGSVAWQDQKVLVKFASALFKVLSDLQRSAKNSASRKRSHELLTDHIQFADKFIYYLPTAMALEWPLIQSWVIPPLVIDSTDGGWHPFADVHMLSDSLKQGEINTKTFQLEYQSVEIPGLNYFGRLRIDWPLINWAYEIAKLSWDGSVTCKKYSTMHNILDFLKSNIKQKYEPDQILCIAHRLDLDLDPWNLANGFLDLKTGEVSFLTYPFLFNFPAQVAIFRALCLSQMQRSDKESFLHTRMITDCLSWKGLKDSNGPYSPEVTSLIRDTLRGACSRYLALSVRRNSLLSDTFSRLWQRQRRELLRPLKVRIDHAGEEGVDQGGIAQELFRLVFAEIFNPDYGAFVVDERTRMAWFDPKSLEPLYKYEMMGVLVSLAVYNGFTVPLTFPHILYRKLCSIPLHEASILAEIEDGWPDLHRGLEQLLSWEDGDVADIMARSYVFSFPVFDKVAHIDMLATPRDASWSVTAAVAHAERIEADAPLVSNANREQYVKDYIFWLTDKSIAPQFEAFRKGFHTCVPPEFLQAVYPSTLQRIVEGAHTLDVNALERVTRYEGYTPEDAVVVNFWDIMRSFPPERRTQLLEFVTASDRLPVTGVENIEFVIQRNGDDSERIPTSTTCFGRLLLPNYDGREKLKGKLEVALDNCAGFGLR